MSYKDLYNLIKKNINFISIVTIFFATTSTAVSLFLKEEFRSYALMAVAQEPLQEGSNQQNPFGGLSGLISLNNSNQDRAELAKEIILSRTFFLDLVSDKENLKNLLAIDYYDKRSEREVYNPDIYNSESELWYNQTKNLGKKQYFDAYEIYIDNIDVELKTNNQFVSIIFTSYSPNFSYQMIQSIVSNLNETVRKSDLKEAENALKYLENELKNSENIEVRESLSKIIESQLKTKMIAYLKDDYVLEYIDYPYIPEKRSFPSRGIIVVFSTIFGFLLSVGVIIFRRYLEDL